jgi:hypothetical protein
MPEYLAGISSAEAFATQQSLAAAYDKAVKLPLWLAEVIGFFVQRFGPKGLEYGRFSIDSHFTRNALWLQRHHPELVERHIPAFARRIVERYRLPEVTGKPGPSPGIGAETSRARAGHDDVESLLSQSRRSVERIEK